jgi:DNA-binding CsgD family transcriptional regulator
LPRLPHDVRPAWAVLLVFLAVGNLLVARLLADASNARRLARAQAAATALEWGGAVAVIGLRRNEAHASTTGVLLLLLAIVGARYRLRGLVLGTLAAWLILALLVLLHANAYGGLTTTDAWKLASERAELIGVMALAISTLVSVSDGERQVIATERERERRAMRSEFEDELRVLLARQESERRALCADHEAELGRYRRERSGLSDREWELLPLLARGLTYAQAAEQLGVELESIRTYVKRTGAKLAVHGRRAIVAEATARGWIADDSPPAPH